MSFNAGIDAIHRASKKTANVSVAFAFALLNDRVNPTLRSKQLNVTTEHTVC